MVFLSACLNGEWMEGEPVSKRGLLQWLPLISRAQIFTVGLAATVFLAVVSEPVTSSDCNVSFGDFSKRHSYLTYLCMQ